MFTWNQIVSEFAPKFGVEQKHLYREVDFVNDSLSRGLLFCPKFKVVERIVKSVAIFVMDIFAFQKRPSKFFSHEDAMLERFSSSTEMQASVSGRVNVAFGIDRSPLAAFVSAFSRTETLAFVVAGVAPVFGFAKTAFFYFTTELALECRRGLFVHERTLAQPFCVSIG